MNLQATCATMAIFGPAESVQALGQMMGRVTRLGQTKKPIIVILTTRDTYEDHIRAEAERKALPILIAQAGLEEDNELQKRITVELSDEFIHFDTGNLAKWVLAERFFQQIVGQPFTMRFVMSLTRPALTRLLNQRGHIPIEKWAEFVERSRNDPGVQKHFPNLIEDYDMFLVQRVEHATNANRFRDRFLQNKLVQGQGTSNSQSHYHHHRHHRHLSSSFALTIPSSQANATANRATIRTTQTTSGQRSRQTHSSDLTTFTKVCASPPRWTDPANLSFQAHKRISAA